MRLGIVGHGAEKFRWDTELRAKTAIEEAINFHKPEGICSGESPMGGVDYYARDAARNMNVPFVPFMAHIHEWNPSDGIGFKQRNLQIAKWSDLVICVVVKELPPGFKGRKFDKDYHCLGKNVPQHVKSGGCWTAWKCKKQEWIII